MLKQQLQIKLSQKLSPQQIQLMKLIQLSTLDLEQRIQSEIGENPALEKGKEVDENELEANDPFDDYQNDQKIDTDDIDIDAYLSEDEIPNYRIQSNNQSPDDENREIPFSGGTSFHEHLENQLQNLILTDRGTTHCGIPHWQYRQQRLLEKVGGRTLSTIWLLPKT
jgi:RNA polymerase sigma-54 factor